MMEAAELRKTLAAFVGDERFKKLVRGRRGCMSFWQEQELRRFIAAHAESGVTPEDVNTALRVCEVHGDELKADEVELFHGCMDYTKEFIETRNRLFPNAATGPVSTEGRPMDGSSIGVWYCPSCRAAKEACEARRKTRR